MYKVLKLTCAVIVQLIIPFVYALSSCRRHPGLHEENKDIQESFAKTTTISETGRRSEVENVSNPYLKCPIVHFTDKSRKPSSGNGCKTQIKKFRILVNTSLGTFPPNTAAPSPS